MNDEQTKQKVKTILNQATWLSGEEHNAVAGSVPAYRNECGDFKKVAADDPTG